MTKHTQRTENPCNTYTHDMRARTYLRFSHGPAPTQMAVTVDYVFNASAEIAAADRYPQIRLMTVGFYNQLPNYKERPQTSLSGKVL